jgi:tetratricopeptide (TPR) repeat protein
VWEPSPETTYYDEVRVDRLKPVRAALAALGLPILRARKLGGIISALEVQIEDGGDHPEVNRLLMEALRVGAVHQVGKRKARPLIKAVDAFERAETARWEQLRAGTLPAGGLSTEAQINQTMMQGYDLLERRDLQGTMDVWLKTWELVKTLATPEMRTVEMFDDAYPRLVQMVFNWTSDLEMELGNAGLDNSLYHEHRVRFVDELLAHFPDEDDARRLQMLRAKGEALFHLGRQEEGDAVYRDLVDRFPDEAWAYIGWSDMYAFGFGVAKDYERAEEILLRALARPELEYRNDVLDRMAMIYGESGQSEAYARTVAQLPDAQRRALARQFPDTARASAPPDKKPRRNAPCWCGSGKKYKDCHWREDRLS